MYNHDNNVNTKLYIDGNIQIKLYKFYKTVKKRKIHIKY